MKAIILAAGVGRRLREAHPEKPKCLLEFGGRSLLARHLALLGELGVQEIHIVTGYQSEQIEAALRNARHPARLLHNPRFRKGSMVSLRCAGEVIQPADQPVLLMDADVLCDPRILARLLAHPAANCLLLDRRFAAGDEPVMVCVRGGRIVEFCKQPDALLERDMQGESVGFFRFAPETMVLIMRRAQRYLDRGEDDAEYEAVIRDTILADPARFDYADITGLPWTEIDFPEDVARAEREILPRLSPSS